MIKRSRGRNRAWTRKTKNTHTNARERLFHIMGKWQIVFNVSADCRSPSILLFEQILFEWRWAGPSPHCVSLGHPLLNEKSLHIIQSDQIHKQGYHHFRRFSHPHRLHFTRNTNGEKKNTNSVQIKAHFIWTNFTYRPDTSFSITVIRIDK